MKKIIIAILISSSLFTSCDIEDTDNVSTVTYYPIVTINGQSTIVINKGTSYTDAGATATSGTATLPVTTTGTVDANKVGVYKIEYKALNSDGFPASKTRTVVVMSTTPSTINLEGTFLRNGNANHVTRISDRVYKCDNATGYTVGSNDTLSLIFYNLDDKMIYAPFTENASVSGLSAESNVGTIDSPNKWYWVIYASGVFGTATRTFTR